MTSSVLVEEWLKSESVIRENYEHLRPKGRYTTTVAYVDASRHVHREGESWTFLGYTSVGAAESIVLFVSADDRHVFGIPIEYGEITRILPCIRASETR